MTKTNRSYINRRVRKYKPRPWPHVANQHRVDSILTEMDAPLLQIVNLLENVPVNIDEDDDDDD